MMFTQAIGLVLAVMLATGAEDVTMSAPAGPGGAVAGPPKSGSDKPEYPPFDEVTKDMKVREGFITLYQDEKKDKLFARIESDALNKNFLLATSIARGPVFTGWQWADAPVYWDRHGKKVLLMLAEPRYVPGKGSTVQDVISRTYTDSILRALPVVTEVDGDALVDLADLMKADVLQLGLVYEGRLDRGLSRFGAPKNFEKNTEIPVDLALMSPEGSGQVVRAHYSFSALPEGDDYQTRVADDRVGYFVTVLKDWTADHSEKTIFRRYINRWQLRKSESDKEVSDVRPEDQIVFYIEKTVPVPYRQYVRDGILEWNKAFEAAGLRNAVMAHQQTDKNEYKDLDPEDVRYNFFRWMVTGQAYAMGPSRVNPFTGQILDADIVFDDSYVRYNLLEYQIEGPRAGGSMSDPYYEEFMERHPQWDPQGFELESRVQKHDPYRAYWELAERNPLFHGHRMEACEMGAGMTSQLSFAAATAAAGGRDMPEEFIGQAIKETVMHEVGHTLGLRHNFKASSWLSLSEIKSRKAQEGQPTTASVMDYNPYTYAETMAEQGSFATPTLGPYDYWAIEYGYRPFVAGMSGGSKPSSADDAGGKVVKVEEKPATDTDKKKRGDGPGPGSNHAEATKAAAEPKPAAAKDQDEDSSGPKDEEAMLRAIASRCAQVGLDYATDEDTFFGMPDPYTNRWDNGSDPMAYAKDRMDAVEKLWKDGLDWAVKDGQSMNRARKVMQRLLGVYGSSAPYVARMVGGQRICRDHKGDPGGRAPMQVVPADQQRAALRFVCDRMLSGSALQFSPALVNSLGAGRWGHWDTDAFDMQVAVELHRWVLSVQARTLMQLMNPFTLNRVYDSGPMVAADQDAVTVPEVLDTISGAVWSELRGLGGGKFDNRRPAVSSYRRYLQRYHLQRLVEIVTAPPGTMMYPDVHAVVRLTMKNLGADLDKALKEHGARLDDFSRAHFTDARSQIERALAAEFVADANARVPRGGARNMREQNLRP